MTDLDKRRVLVQKGTNGEFEDCNFTDLSEGDIFKMYEPNTGEPVIGRDGVDVFIALSYPYKIHEVYTIQARPYYEEV